MAFDFWFSYGKPQGMYVNGVPFTMPMERSIVPSGSHEAKQVKGLEKGMSETHVRLWLRRYLDNQHFTKSWTKT